MLSRRKFLKIFGLTGLAISVLPSFLVRKSFSSAVDDIGTNPLVRNWLNGSARRGCSSPDLAWEYHGQLEDGVRSFAGFCLPPPVSSTFV